MNTSLNMKPESLLEVEKAVALVFQKAFEEGSQINGVLGVIDDVQSLLESVIQGDTDRAEKYVARFSNPDGKDLFVEVGKITRKLHDSIREFQIAINPRLQNLPIGELPEASDKLQWVIKKTEEAAERTISLVEKHLESQEEVSKFILQLETSLKEKGPLNEEDARAMDYLKNMNQELPKDLMEILIAQDFQDLTGQIIKKVIQLIADIEKQLVKILTIFGVQMEPVRHTDEPKGPAIVKHEGVVSDQSEVDDLLKGFGF
jgi:chemotaxis regulatin CheY-phosphate phosphatase CheZ